MTQITIRKVDDVLAERIRESAKTTGESMNSLLLRLLRRQFLPDLDPSGEPAPRNDLRKYRKGWIEDPQCEEALRDFDRIDEDDWK